MSELDPSRCSETTVVDLETVRKSRLPAAVLATAFIDPRSELDEGDSVAYSFGETPQFVVFDVWLGPSGRDYGGRFVRTGSLQETVLLGRMSVSRAHLRAGRIRLHGKLCAVGRMDGTIAAPPPAA